MSEKFIGIDKDGNEIKTSPEEFKGKKLFFIFTPKIIHQAVLRKLVISEII